MTCVGITTTSWDCSRIGADTFPAIDLETGASYSIGDTQVLSATALGSTVVGSSLTSVGTLSGVTVSGTAALNGAVTLGDAGSDTITVNGAVTFANGAQHTATTIAAGAVPGPITSGLSMVRVTNSGASQAVKLPSAVVGVVVTLIRGTTANSMTIKPADGEDINGGGADVALTWSTSQRVVVCVGVTAGAQWECQRRGSGSVSRRRLSSSTSAEKQSWSQRAMTLFAFGSDEDEDIVASDVDIVDLLREVRRMDAKTRRLEYGLVLAVVAIFALLLLAVHLAVHRHPTRKA